MKRIEIDNIRLCHAQIVFGCSYATDNLDMANSLILSISSKGVSGWGEVFLPRVEPQWSWALKVLPGLIGQDANELDSLLDRWPAGQRPRMTLEECSTYCHPEVDLVAEAVSFALYDLVSRQMKRPVRELFGNPVRTVIPGMPCISLADAETMASLCKEWVALGYRYIKIKLSGVLQDDSRRIEATRKAVGTSVSIQVDANNSYRSMDHAVEIIAVLNENHVEVIEDLFGFGELADCRKAKDMLEGKYMVDKDAYWPHVLTLLDQGVAAIINQHPHNQGRVSYALNIARAAAAAGVSSQIGSSGIFGIQNAAYQQLASVIGTDRPCEEIGLHSYYDGPSRRIYSFDRRPSVLTAEMPSGGGMILLNNRPGMGVEVDQDKLKSMTVKAEDIGP